MKQRLAVFATAATLALTMTPAASAQSLSSDLPVADISSQLPQDVQMLAALSAYTPIGLVWLSSCAPFFLLPSSVPNQCKF